mmetsp:Transcript_54304/g.116680  ORF Transcript_54304/g.116680 Transcript_54304/m.116680 type:complete len:214 (-) Transcript_54304:156-797(-)
MTFIFSSFGSMALKPKYKLKMPFPGRRSSFQTMTTLCTPSRLAESTTYSLPFKNSCIRISPILSPNDDTLPTSLRNISSACLRLYTFVTPSLLDPWRILKMTGLEWDKGGFKDSRYSFASFHVVTTFSLTERSPALRTASLMINLSRLAFAKGPLNGFPLTPTQAARRSVKYTAGSKVAMTAAIGTPILRSLGQISSAAKESFGVNELYVMFW